MVVETDDIMKPGWEIPVGDNSLEHLDVAAKMARINNGGVWELDLEHDVERVLGSDITIVSISMNILYSSHEPFIVLAISRMPSVSS